MSTPAEQVGGIRPHFARQASNRGLQLAVAALLLVPLLTACLGGETVAPTGAIDPPPAVVLLDMQRGQSLYETQCATCHTTQAHWRNNSIVSSWSDVLAQVQRWQHNAGLHWSPSEIGDVAAYLNATYYKMPCSTPGCQGTDGRAGRTPEAGVIGDALPLRKPTSS